MVGNDPSDWLSTSDLVAPVTRLLATNDLSLGSWSCLPLVGGGGETIGVWRVTGQATVDGIATPFALILKGWRAADGPADPASWNWPHREVRAYTSGVLDSLPGGVCAPTCLGDVAGGDGLDWAWLSPMSTGSLDHWGLEHFALVARRLGQFNGAYLSNVPLPAAPWLSRQWTRQWTEAAADAMNALAQQATPGRYARAFPAATVRALQGIWNERQVWFDTLDTLPQTFCHLDAFKRNAFLRPMPGGDFNVGLIDWAFTGIAALGEEIVSLVASSLAFGEAPGISPAALDRAVFEGYLSGLRDAGWRGDEMLVRAAYTGSLALRYGLGTKRVAQPVVTNVELHPVFERTLGAPIDVIVDRIASLDEWVIDLAAEFRGLLATLPTRREVV